MTPQSFNWFLHTMLFYHTKNVIKKQVEKARKTEAAQLNDDEDSGSIQTPQS
jgi:hypothetical protein